MKVKFNKNSSGDFDVFGPNIYEHLDPDGILVGQVYLDPELGYRFRPSNQNLGPVTLAAIVAFLAEKNFERDIHKAQ